MECNCNDSDIYFIHDDSFFGGDNFIHDDSEMQFMHLQIQRCSSYLHLRIQRCSTSSIKTNYGDAVHNIGLSPSLPLEFGAHLPNTRFNQIELELQASWIGDAKNWDRKSNKSITKSNSLMRYGAGEHSRTQFGGRCGRFGRRWRPFAGGGGATQGIGTRKEAAAVALATGWKRAMFSWVARFSRATREQPASFSLFSSHHSS